MTPSQWNFWLHLPFACSSGEAVVPLTRDRTKGPPFGPEGRYRITRDDLPLGEARTAMEAACQLRADIDLTLAVLARDGLFVHAGAVSWQGHGIVIPGRSMTGKSTLVAELLRRGATYYSDEFAVLDDVGCIHPYARPLLLRGGPRSERGVTAEQLGSGRAVEPVPLALIVSTSYRAGAVWGPGIRTGTRAVLPLIDNVVRAREEPRRTVKVAAALAPTVVTLAGARPSAEAVAPAILRFVTELAVGKPTTRPAPGGAAGRAAEWARRRVIGSRERTRAARYLRIEHFLEPDEVRRLLDHTLARAAEFIPSEVALDTGVVLNPSYRQSRTIFDLDEVWDLFERRLRALLPHVRKELETPWFPLGTIERQLTAHHEGGFYHVHTDNGGSASDTRRLTAVYHFYREPKRFSGGDLWLHDTAEQNGNLMPAGRSARLDPLHNSLVFFASDVFHEVCSVFPTTADFGDSRFAVTMWVRAGKLPERFLRAPNVLLAAL